MYNANVSNTSIKSFIKKIGDSGKSNFSLEEIFNFFVHQASAVITIVDKDGTIIYQSPSIKEILGYNYRKRIGQNFLYSRIVHPEDVPVKEELLKKAFKTPNKNFTDELRMLHKDGSWRWMEVVFNNQLENFNITGIVVITHDITERKTLEIQKNEFISIASHELKTPLTAIRAYSQVLAKRLLGNKSRAQELSFLDKIISQTDKITNLINELLDISKIQEGKFSIQKSPLLLEPLIKKIIDDFHYMSDSFTIKLVCHTQVPVLADEERIGQVIINLLTNAIKYSSDSKKITIEVTKKNKEVITSVKDRGEGILLEQQPYVFQRFFKGGKNNTHNGSSGLGLYISSEIIKLHNGNIWLKSKKGKGSVFYFSLPLYK